MVCRSLNYIEHLLILAFAVTECVFVSAFPSVFGIHKGIAISVVELKAAQ